MAQSGCRDQACVAQPCNAQVATITQQDLDDAPSNGDRNQSFHRPR